MVGATGCGMASSFMTEEAPVCLCADKVDEELAAKNTVLGKASMINFETGKVWGDVNIPEALAVARYVTPTPGGVGPITVAKLLNNVVLAAERKIKK